MKRDTQQNVMMILLIIMLILNLISLFLEK